MSRVCSTLTLPTTSLNTANSLEMPATFIEIIVDFGNARPIPSASRTATPSDAAQPTGATPLLPPISAAITAVTGRPMMRSTSTMSVCTWALAPSISIPTEGAPMPESRMTASSGPSSSTVMSRTGPN